MTKRFEVGQKVRVNYPQSSYHGQECTVIRKLTYTELQETCGGKKGRKYWTWAYRVDLLPAFSGFEGVSFDSHNLTPIYDGQEKVSWESCVWSPKSLKARV